MAKIRTKLLTGFTIGMWAIASHAQTGTQHFNVTLFGNVDTLRGAKISALTNVVKKDMKGVQISGISNFASHGDGLQISLLSNAAVQEFKGVQIAGISNISMGMKRGMQMSVAANVCSSYMRGIQVGGYNYADSLNGTQIGSINACVSHPRGVQIGIINYSRDTVAHKIGLVNVNPKTRIDLMAYGGTSTKMNVGIRFRNKSTYNILGVGTHYMGLDKRFSGALFYRIGQYFQLSPHFSLSGDLGYYHIETFQEHSAENPERLFSLQARINGDWQLTKHTSVFASVGYGDTRYYHHARHYRNRMLLEGGVAFRLVRSNSSKNELPISISQATEDEHKLYEVLYGNAYDALGTDSIMEAYAFNDPSRQKKHPWKAAIEAFGINVGVQCFDQFVMNEDFAKISLHSIKHNIQNGFVWDNDQFSTNLFAHPYHGGLYFNAARSNGMTFWESIPYSFCGSLMWETTCEIEPPAINDLMATTIGGVCIGEVTHRISNLVYDDRQRGFGRFLREFLGAIVCPIKELNRIISGDAWRVRGKYYKYHDYDKLPIDFSVSTGYRYLADNNSLFRGEGDPYVHLSLIYGDPFKADTNKPYDFFTTDLTFGLSSNQPLITSVHLLGRLWGAHVIENNDLKVQFGIFQHFNYYDSQPVKDGTNEVPYRISEAASIGPGILCSFPTMGSLTKLQQGIFLDGIILGGSLSDYYHIIDRDYNMGSGYSLKAKTKMEFGKIGSLQLIADYYRIFTWKGYENKDLTTTDPLYLNAQGDKGNASLLVTETRMLFNLSKHFGLDLGASYYWRYTYYSYHDNVKSRTYDVHIGLQYKI